MVPIIKLVRDQIGDSLRRYAEVMGRTLKDSVRRATRGVTRRVIDLTPPANEGATGAAAYRQGRVRIARQMNAILAPVRIRGRRVISVVFGRRLATPVSVRTKELYPDVRQTYSSELKRSANGSRLKLTNFRGRKYYVKRSKYQAELKRRQGHVGRMASGFYAAARALDLPVQEWISRHGTGRGTIKQDLMTSRMRITVANFAPGVSPAIRAELARRIPFALQYQAAAMQREVNYMVYKKAQEMAIRTRNFAALVPEGMQGR